MKLSLQRLIAKILIEKKIIIGILASTNILFLLLFLQCSYFSCSENEKSLLQQKRRNVNAMDGQNKINTFLFIMIMTSPTGVKRRKAMRDTWLNSKSINNLKVEWRFIIGIKDLPQLVAQDLAKEQSTHNDLLFFQEHKDSYYSLTEKLLKTIVWTSKNVNSRFVMKVDDDSFVRLNILTDDLKRRENLQRMYMGYFNGKATVKQTGPWAEKSWILSDYYLPYARGGGYLVSFDLIEYLSKSPDMLQLYNSEDVSIGVWLAPIRLNRIHDIRFDTEYKSRGCSNSHIVSHKQTAEDMYNKYKSLKNSNQLCKEENEVLHVYDYNWNVPPSQCCKRVSLNSLNEMEKTYDKIDV